jgi:hypothetical protein
MVRRPGLPIWHHFQHPADSLEEQARQGPDLARPTQLRTVVPSGPQPRRPKIVHAPIGRRCPGHRDVPASAQPVVGRGKLRLPQSPSPRLGQRLHWNRWLAGPPPRVARAGVTGIAERYRVIRHDESFREPLSYGSLAGAIIYAPRHNSLHYYLMAVCALLHCLLWHRDGGRMLQGCCVMKL